MYKEIELEKLSLLKQNSEYLKYKYNLDTDYLVCIVCYCADVYTEEWQYSILHYIDNKKLKSVGKIKVYDRYEKFEYVQEEGEVYVPPIDYQHDSIDEDQVPDAVTL